MNHRKRIIALLNQHRKESPKCPKAGCFCVDVELFEISYPLMVAQANTASTGRAKRGAKSKSLNGKGGYKAARQ